MKNKNSNYLMKLVLIKEIKYKKSNLKHIFVNILFAFIFPFVKLNIRRKSYHMIIINRFPDILGGQQVLNTKKKGYLGG